MKTKDKEVSRPKLSMKAAGERGRSRTQQQFKHESAIPTLIARHKATGFFYDPLKHKPTAKPMFGDFTNVRDYYDARNKVVAANNAFASLPSRVRERFQHDPGKMLSFLENEDNLEESYKLGLRVKPKEEPKAIPAGGDAAKGQPETAADPKGKGEPKAGGKAPESTKST